jgi:hypothetical protein
MLEPADSMVAWVGSMVVFIPEWAGMAAAGTAVGVDGTAPVGAMVDTGTVAISALAGADGAAAIGVAVGMARVGADGGESACMAIRMDITAATAIPIAATTTIITESADIDV